MCVFLFVLRMTHLLHCASRATAAARGFSLFFVTAHSDDDERTNGDQDEGNEDGCEILSDPIEHGNTSFVLFYG